MGLIFVFGWESLVMALPGYLKRFSVAYYLQGLVPHAMPSDSPLSLMQAIFRETPSLSESLIWMADHRGRLPLAGRPDGSSEGVCARAVKSQFRNSPVPEPYN